MKNLLFARSSRLCAAGLALALAGGCSSLLPKPAPLPTFHSLDIARPEARAATPAPLPLPVPSTAPTLVVNPPHAAAGFDNRRIIYLREEHKLEYFARSEWVDTPARMLAPLIVAALDNGRSFRAVVQAPSAALGDISLDTEIVRLQQSFGGAPSRVRFTLRAYMVDSATRRVLAWREFDETVAAASEDAAGGVVAANRAVPAVLQRLAGFCTEAARYWQPAAADSGKSAGRGKTAP